MVGENLGRPQRRDDAECPVCGARLQGSRFSGYSCGKCASHFSGRFIMGLRRRSFKERLAMHFDPPTPQKQAQASAQPAPPAPQPVVREEKEEFTIEDDGRIQETIDRAHIAVQEMVREVEHAARLSAPLEELVDAQDPEDKPVDVPQQGRSVPRTPRVPRRSISKPSHRAAQRSASKAVTRRVTRKRTKPAISKKPATSKKPAKRRAAGAKRKPVVRKRHASRTKRRR